MAVCTRQSEIYKRMSIFEVNLVYEYRNINNKKSGGTTRHITYPMQTYKPHKKIDVYLPHADNSYPM